MDVMKILMHVNNSDRACFFGGGVLSIIGLYFPACTHTQSVPLRCTFVSLFSEMVMCRCVGARATMCKLRVHLDVCVCMYVCMCVCVCWCVCWRVSVCMCACAGMYVQCMCVCVRVRLCACA